ncbi:Cyclic di-GMP phosphodiesterase Gmr [Thalassocella blandensis]|nr:Cyclic di-GMP phosphodiesterase Gmr [Thalassocella blandensis]
MYQELYYLDFIKCYSFAKQLTGNDQVERVEKAERIHMNILLVDSDDKDRERLKRILKSGKSRCLVDEATTVNEGLQVFNSKHYDLVLMDFYMPQRDGIEMLLEIRNDRSAASTTLIVTSTEENETLALNCLHAGAHDFIVKSDICWPRLRRAITNAETRFDLEGKLLESYKNAKKLAEHDSLTGLANRYLFDEYTKNAILSHERSNNKLAVVFIDIDNFKFINDAYGHDLGDEFLKQVVERIRNSLRGNEIFARLGGDEFGLTLTNLRTNQDASRVAKRILNLLDKPFDVEDKQIKASASIGISVFPDQGKSTEDLFKFADIAMYRAKKLGKNQACFFEGQMQEQFSARYKLENQLRTALRDKQFILYYQPVIDTADNTLKGFEALIRWCVDGKLYSPDTFIPIAEQSNLIMDIGRWVIENAIEQRAQWQHLGEDLSMAINLSAVQLSDTTLPRFIARLLEKHQVNPRTIEFELTETALLENSTAQVLVINEIHNMGCRIALDDFGTGFSSVSHLRNFPISTVKIDKSLMPNKNSAKKEIALISGLAAMIHSLELEIIGEGVESLEHLELCRQLKIHNVQGYFFDKPLPSYDLEQRYCRLPANHYV